MVGTRAVGEPADPFARGGRATVLVWPAGARVGDNVLLATKAALPLDGPVRRDVGLLGSPAFEIPRTVHRDADEQREAEELRRGLAGKNRYNLRTIALFTLVR
jgi:hypothetical protein